MAHPEYLHIGRPESKATEECAELILALAKADRFGLFNFHPESRLLNITAIRYEIADVTLALATLTTHLHELEQKYYENSLQAKPDPGSN